MRSSRGNVDQPVRGASSRFLGLIVAVILVAAGCSGSSGDKGSGTTTTSASTTSQPVQSSGPTVPVLPSKSASSEGWVVMSLHTSRSSAGQWAGTAGIQNTSEGDRLGNFIFDLSRDGHQIAELIGSAGQVKSGQTATVRLESGDPFSAGDYLYVFRVTFGF